MRREVIVQAFGVEQHFHSVEADAAAVGMLLRAVRTAIKQVEDVLELLFSEWFAGVFDGQLALVAGDCYHTPGVAVAYRI